MCNKSNWISSRLIVNIGFYIREVTSIGVSFFYTQQRSYNKSLSGLHSTWNKQKLLFEIKHILTNSAYEFVWRKLTFRSFTNIQENSTSEVGLILPSMSLCPKPLLFICFSMIVLCALIYPLYTVWLAHLSILDLKSREVSRNELTWVNRVVVTSSIWKR